MNNIMAGKRKKQAEKDRTQGAPIATPFIIDPIDPADLQNFDRLTMPLVGREYSLLDMIIGDTEHKHLIPLIPPEIWQKLDDKWYVTPMIKPLRAAGCSPLSELFHRGYIAVIPTEKLSRLKPEAWFEIALGFIERERKRRKQPNLGATFKNHDPIWAFFANFCQLPESIRLLGGKENWLRKVELGEDQEPLSTMMKTENHGVWDKISMLQLALFFGYGHAVPKVILDSLTDEELKDQHIEPFSKERPNTWSIAVSFLHERFSHDDWYQAAIKTRNYSDEASRIRFILSDVPAKTLANWTIEQWLTPVRFRGVTRPLIVEAIRQRVSFSQTNTESLKAKLRLIQPIIWEKLSPADLKILWEAYKFNRGDIISIFPPSLRRRYSFDKFGSVLAISRDREAMISLLREVAAAGELETLTKIWAEYSKSHAQVIAASSLEQEYKEIRTVAFLIAQGKSGKVKRIQQPKSPQ